ncbi:MAG: hypothetical protein HKN06_09770 [Gammaproteobacteria bacterium]|nr:hypothetical protein [Gammaproteobacteria bacterium]
MLMPARLLAALIFGAVLSHSAAADEETLQNDGFADGAPVNFQAGFIAGEIAAARFEPKIACPCVLSSITLLFGGAAVSREMGISVWDDAGGGSEPGSLLFTGDVTLTGSNVFLQQIDLTLTPIIINGPFRVGLQFGHNGLPSIATDLDGTINAGANYILADIGAGLLFWFPASQLGVGGDFVMRATIDNLVEPDLDADGIPDSTDNCIEVINADQRDTDADNIGNACDPDLNNDCQVDLVDLALFRLVFLTADPDADYNGDDRVDLVDLALMRTLFLQPPGPSATGCVVTSGVGPTIRQQKTIQE